MFDIRRYLLRDNSIATTAAICTNSSGGDGSYISIDPDRHANGRPLRGNGATKAAMMDWVIGFLFGGLIGVGVFLVCMRAILRVPWP
jgi:hypothetical protein